MPTPKLPLRVLAWPSGTPQELNPYVRLMYSAFVPPAANITPYKPLQLLVQAADVFHVHWPEGIFNGRLGAIPPLAALKAERVLRTARRIRRHGGLVVLTAHNAVPHMKLAGWRRTLWQNYHPRLLREAGLLVGLTEGGLAAYRAANPASTGIAGCVVPHPHFKTTYPPPPSRRVARLQLGLPADRYIIGIIGSMRRSKQIGEAIRAFRQTAAGNEILLVLGSCDDELWNELLQEAGDDKRVRLQRGALNDLELATAFGTIDVCLLNQGTTLNSSTALLALSFGVPVIAPDVGSLPDLKAFCGESWLSLFVPPLIPATFRQLLDNLPKGHQSPCDAIDQLAPEHLSARLLEHFRHSLTMNVQKPALP
jgi:beta-1,4-mannosyltransferase